jgi:protein tyrosine phosphatase (PTP) superfamily phosphohydrolase (DUF442 family)
MRSLGFFFLGVLCVADLSDPMARVLAGTPTTTALAPRSNSAQIVLPGLHNVFRITEKLYSGSSPDCDLGFRSLQKLGVKTVISVDGARPEVATAHLYGMRYVHIPFGYDGIPPEQTLRLAKAVRDLPGPIYIHCHHGMHRGPAAASAIHLCLDRNCTVNQALAEMHRAGTDPHYTGLYAVPRTLVRPSNADLDPIASDFPEVATVPDLAECMVGIDKCWDNLKQIRSAGWKTPANQQDLDPAHEALMLRESFQESLRVSARFQRAEFVGAHSRPAEVGLWLADAVEKATSLEQRFRSGAEHPALEHAFTDMGACCTRCHAKYRDVPQGP